VAHQTQDDGFHEIQLNGKQLVFLFMAATVVSVVIFLCGVLVGRGVPYNRSVSAAEAGSVPIGEEPPAQAPAASPAPAKPEQDRLNAEPPAPADEEPSFSYPGRLGKPNAPEQLKPSTEHNAPPAAQRTPAAAPHDATPPPAPKQPARETTPPPAKQPPARATTAPPAAHDMSRPEPGGSGYAVQIAALNVRSEADAIARRLSSKGYAAYVLSPAAGTPSVYRVRVGKFPTKREAETIAAKLQKEEQFKPWVTR
jgi:DedD protein